jgi:hypothetical protein
MDVHVKTAIAAGVRRRGIDVITAQENGATRLEDVSLLDRATALGRVLSTAILRQSPEAVLFSTVHFYSKVTGEQTAAVGVLPQNA